MKLASAAFFLIALVSVASAQTTAPLGPGSGGGPGGGGGGASPAGATGTVQYNAGGGLFGGITNWKTSGTNDLTGSGGSTLAVNGCTIGSYAMCTGGTSNLVGAVTLGTQQTTQGSLVLANTAAGAFSTTLQSSNSATAAYTITLPVAAPVGNGYALTATTGGVASWSNIGTGPFLPLAGGTMSGALTNTATAPQIILGVNTSVGGGIQMYGASSGNLTLQPAAAAGSSVTVTIPGATDTLANLASSQTLTNKTIAFASNTMTGVAPLASPTFTGTVTMPDSSAWTSSGIGSLVALGVGESVPSSGQIYASGLIRTASAGSAATPSIAVGNSTTGFYSASTTGFGVTVNGSSVVDYGINVGGTWNFGATVRVPNLTMVGGNINMGSNYIAWSSAYMFSNATATVQFGLADAASPVAQTLKFQGATGTNTAGVNDIIIASLGTGTGPSGNLVLEVGKTGTTGSTQNTGYPLVTLNAGNATGATVQFGDGTNFTTYDSCTALTTGATGVIACTASARRFKEINGKISEDQAVHGLDLLTAGEWTYKPEYQNQFGGGAEHVSLYADDVARMDPRCATYENGMVHDYWDRCVVAYLVTDRNAWKDAFQRKVAEDDMRFATQQAEIEQLKRKVH